MSLGRARSNAVCNAATTGANEREGSALTLRGSVVPLSVSPGRPLEALAHDSSLADRRPSVSSRPSAPTARKVASRAQEILSGFRKNRPPYRSHMSSKHHLNPPTKLTHTWPIRARVSLPLPSSPEATQWPVSPLPTSPKSSPLAECHLTCAYLKKCACHCRTTDQSSTGRLNPIKALLSSRSQKFSRSSCTSKESAQFRNTSLSNVHLAESAETSRCSAVDGCKCDFFPGRVPLARTLSEGPQQFGARALSSHETQLKPRTVAPPLLCDGIPYDTPYDSRSDRSPSQRKHSCDCSSDECIPYDTPAHAHSDSGRSKARTRYSRSMCSTGSNLQSPKFRMKRHRSFTDRLRSISRSFSPRPSVPSTRSSSTSSQSTAASRSKYGRNLRCPSTGFNTRRQSPFKSTRSKSHSLTSPVFQSPTTSCSNRRVRAECMISVSHGKVIVHSLALGPSSIRRARSSDCVLASSSNTISRPGSESSMDNAGNGLRSLPDDRTRRSGILPPTPQNDSSHRSPPRRSRNRSFTKSFGRLLRGSSRHAPTNRTPEHKK